MAFVDSADLAGTGSGQGAEMVGFRQNGTVVARTAADKLRDSVNVRDFGALGDAAADDTAKIQAAIDYCQVNRIGTLVFPAVLPTCYYKVTAPLVVTASLRLVGAGETVTTIMGVGLSGTDHVIDCDGGAGAEHVEISGLTVRSDDGAPSGIRLNNMAYAVLRGVRLYTLKDGISLAGLRCFSHSFYDVTGYEMSRSTVSFPGDFAGGGQFIFTGCTFTGDVGVVLSPGSFIDNLAFTGCNWEQCDTHGLFAEGTIAGLSIVGSRCEGNDNADFVIRPNGADEYVGGLLISGCVLSASDSGGANRIVLGGGDGKVRGFQISANVVTHGDDEFRGKLVQLNGDGESGLVTGNFIRGLTGDGAGVINAARAGVIVFGNENRSGKLAEQWGLADWAVEDGTWTPADGSGAGLSFATAAGRYTRIGRQVFWQAKVTYPSTADASAASIAGLPFSVGGLAGANVGQAGASVDATDYAGDVGALHGSPSATQLALILRQTSVAITNASASGKSFTLSGSYLL